MEQSNGSNGSQPLPEAPASCTLKAVYRGYELLFTLRDHSGAYLLQKVDAAITALEKMGAEPAPIGKGRGPSKRVPAPADGSVPLCPEHGAMRPSNYGGFYCPHRDEAGNYCTYKAK